MNKKNCMITIFIVLILSILNEKALSWETNPTHKDLSLYAAKNSVLSETKGDYLRNLGFEGGIEESLKWEGKEQIIEKWLQEGAVLEDKMDFDGIRPMNHFHNPLKPWDSAGLNDFFSGDSSLLWAQGKGEQSNDWTWQEARDRYYLSLTSKIDDDRQENFARTFRCLGHQMHLVQDTAVPAHVRNDKHPLPFNKIGGLHLEKWARKYHGIINGFAQSSDPPTVNLNTEISYNGGTLVPITQFIDADEYNGSNPSTSLSIGLAEYTNANFFSDDTIFAAEEYQPGHVHYFPYPKKSNTNIQEYIDQNLPPETNAEAGDTEFHISKFDANGDRIVDYFVQPTYHTSDMIGSDQYLMTFYLSEKCHEDYSEILIPRAVGYSAALLDYFFRGKMDLIENPDNPGSYVIENLTEEEMDGTFELYYDKEDGDERVKVSEQHGDFPITTVIEGGGKSGNIDFTAPNDAKEPGKYILVFSGRLGNETDAVVGKVVHEVGTYLYIWGYISEYTKRQPPCDIPGNLACLEMCTVWNIRKDAVADIVDNNGDPVTFPIHMSEISDWIDNQEVFTKAKTLLDLTTVSKPALPYPPGPWSEPYNVTVSALNKFGTNTGTRTASASGNSGEDPMWCEGSFLWTIDETFLTGKRYTALNNSGVFIDAVNTSVERESILKEGSWVEGETGTGSTSIEESKTLRLELPIFNVIQTGGYSQSGECSGEPNDPLRCVCSCDPFEEDAVEKHIPSVNSFTAKGHFYDIDSDTFKWIFIIASMEDNTTRTPPESNKSNGDRVAWGGLLSGADVDPQQSPLGMSENEPFTEQLQAIFDQTEATDLMYQIYQ